MFTVERIAFEVDDTIVGVVEEIVLVCARIAFTVVTVDIFCGELVDINGIDCLTFV